MDKFTTLEPLSNAPTVFSRNNKITTKDFIDGTVSPKRPFCNGFPDFNLKACITTSNDKWGYQEDSSDFTATTDCTHCAIIDAEVVRIL